MSVKQTKIAIKEQTAKEVGYDPINSMGNFKSVTSTLQILTEKNQHKYYRNYDTTHRTLLLTQISKLDVTTSNNIVYIVTTTTLFSTLIN